MHIFTFSPRVSTKWIMAVMRDKCLPPLDSSLAGSHQGARFPCRMGYVGLVAVGAGMLVWSGGQEQQDNTCHGEQRQPRPGHPTQGGPHPHVAPMASSPLKPCPPRQTMSQALSPAAPQARPEREAPGPGSTVKHPAPGKQRHRAMGRVLGRRLHSACKVSYLLLLCSNATQWAPSSSCRASQPLRTSKRRPLC